jgi:hypothetical protein
MLFGCGTLGKWSGFRPGSRILWNSRPQLPQIRTSVSGWCDPTALGREDRGCGLGRPEVVDREVPGSAAENRWEKRTYLLLRKLRSRLDRVPAPNTPTRLHIAPQPDQETAQPSQFARRSRFVETPAFLTGPQSTGGEAS